VLFTGQGEEEFEAVDHMTPLDAGRARSGCNCKNVAGKAPKCSASAL
jgi:hypothetical protein